LLTFNGNFPVFRKFPGRKLFQMSVHMPLHAPRERAVSNHLKMVSTVLYRMDQMDLCVSDSGTIHLHLSVPHFDRKKPPGGFSIYEGTRHCSEQICLKTVQNVHNLSLEEYFERIGYPYADVEGGPSGHNTGGGV